MSVVIVKESSYNYTRLRRDVFDILSHLDRDKIKDGSRVLIKPNLLTAAKKDKAITTHPLIIKAATEYVLQKRGNPQVSDSPAVGTFKKVIKECGVEDALKGMPVAIKEFRSSRKISVDGRFRNMEIAHEALLADVIINLPKLKTHSQMGLTLAVKNLFGCVIGFRKPEWHYRVGVNKEMFAELLLTIYHTLAPSMNLLDGILAMEGDGPGSGGTPRDVGVLIGSDDALSIDVVVCKMIGIDPLSLITTKIGKRLGMLREFNLSGELKKVDDFSLPSTTDLLFGPKFAQKFIRYNVTSPPASDSDLCKFCNECATICPAKAIENRDKNLEFDYEKCIRCFCCMEVCPHKAIKIHEPFVDKTIKKFVNRS